MSTGSRSSKFILRNRFLVATTATIVTLLVSGIAGTSWIVWNAGLAERLANNKATEVRRQKEIADTKTIEANEQRVRADINAAESAKRYRNANSLRLVAQSKQNIRDFPSRALLLAVEAANVTRNHGEPMLPFVREQLYSAVTQISGKPLLGKSSKSQPISLSDGSWVYSTREGIVRESGVKRERINGSHGISSSLCVSEDEQWLVESGDGVAIWNLQTLDAATNKHFLWEGVSYPAVQFSSEGTRFFAAGADNARVWNVSPRGFDLLFDLHDETWLSPSSASLRKLSPNGKWWSLPAQKKVELLDLRSENPIKHELETASESSPTSMTFSDDGNWFAAAGHGFCRVWNLRATDIAGSAIDLPGSEPGKVDPVSNVVAFGPESDILIRSVGYLSGHCEFWHLKQKPEMLVSLPHLVHVAKFTPRKNKLVTLTRSSMTYGYPPNGPGILRVWDIGNQKMSEVKRVPRFVGSILPVDSFAVSPASESIVTVDRNGKIQLWDLEDHTIRKRHMDFVGLDKGRVTVGFNKDGTQLTAETNRQSARVWDLEKASGKTLAQNKRAASIFHFKRNWIIAVDKVNRWPATFWNIETGRTGVLEYGRRMLNQGGTHEISFLQDAVSSHGSLLVGSDRIWDLDKEDPLANATVFADNGFGEGPIGLSPSGRLLAVFDRRRKVRQINIFDLETRLLVKELPGEFRYRTRFGFSTNGHWFVAKDPGSHDVRLWDTKALDRAPIVLSMNKEVEFHQIRFLNSDKLVVITEFDDTYIWSVDSSDLSPKPIVLKSQKTLAISKPRQLLVTIDKDQSLRLWDLKSSKNGPDSVLLKSDSVNGKYLGRFDVDGRRLVVVRESTNPVCMVWDFNDGPINPSPRVYSMDRFNGESVLSDDGVWLASGYNSKEVWLFNLDDGRLDKQPIILTGHQASLSKFKFSPNSRWLFTGSGIDGRLWDLSASDVRSSKVELPVRRNQLRSSGINVDFSDDSRWLATQTDAIVVFELAENELIDSAKALAGRELSEDERIWFEIE